jgi:hypothetical protein
MCVYKVQITISGLGNKPEKREERIVAPGWQKICELMAEICRDTGCVIKDMTIQETHSHPFDHRTVRESDSE